MSTLAHCIDHFQHKQVNLQVSASMIELRDTGSDHGYMEINRSTLELPTGELSLIVCVHVSTSCIHQRHRQIFIMSLFAVFVMINKSFNKCFNKLLIV